MSGVAQRCDSGDERPFPWLRQQNAERLYHYPTLEWNRFSPSPSPLSSLPLVLVTLAFFALFNTLVKLANMFCRLLLLAVFLFFAIQVAIAAPIPVEGQAIEARSKNAQVQLNSL